MNKRFYAKKKESFKVTNKLWGKKKVAIKEIKSFVKILRKERNEKSIHLERLISINNERNTKKQKKKKIN